LGKESAVTHWFQSNGPVLITAVGGLGVAIITGFVTLLAGRGSIAVQVQKVLNESARQLAELQTSHIAACESKCLELEGANRKLVQRIYALENIMRGQGFDIPRQPLTETVFVLDSRSDPIEDSLNPGTRDILKERP
jgi:hypothetical protein